MKYAVITDVHSNIDALKAVFKKIDSLSVDKVICLGDIVGNGFYPEECVGFLRKRQNVVAVSGNHDMFVLLDLSQVKNEDPRLSMFRWQQKVLSTASKRYLSELQREIIIEDSGKKIVCVHYPENGRGRFKKLIYLPTEEQVKELFCGMEGDVFLFGHEHTGSMHEINGKYYLNFGTLGNFLKKDKTVFGLLNIDENGVTYKAVEVDYDDEKMRRKTEEINKILESKQ